MVTSALLITILKPLTADLGSWGAMLLQARASLLQPIVMYTRTHTHTGTQCENSAPNPSGQAEMVLKL